MGESIEAQEWPRQYADRRLRVAREHRADVDVAGGVEALWPHGRQGQAALRQQVNQVPVRHGPQREQLGHTL